MKHATALAAQVAAWNRVNAEANLIAKRQALEKAEKAFHDAQSDLSPFKRFDW